MCGCEGLYADDPARVTLLYLAGTIKILPHSSKERGPGGEVNLSEVRVEYPNIRLFISNDL